MAANYSIHAFLLLAFPLMLFKQGHAAGENCRESKEEPSEAGPTFLRDYAGAGGYQTAENKTQQELPPFRPFQSGCADGYNHRGQLTITYQSPVATPIQRSNRNIATGSAARLNRKRM